MNRFDNRSAREIYQDHLDTLTCALMDADLNACRDRFAFPHHVRTLSMNVTVETNAHFEKLARSVMQNLRDEGITRYIRIAKHAAFVTDTVIEGEHESHRFRGDTLHIPPYRNRVRLERGADGHWRETHCTNAILNRAGHFEMTEVPRIEVEAPQLADREDGVHRP